MADKDKKKKSDFPKKKSQAKVKQKAISGKQPASDGQAG
jgi:hypothetical protein